MDPFTVPGMESVEMGFRNLVRGRKEKRATITQHYPDHPRPLDRGGSPKLPGPPTVHEPRLVVRW